MRFAATVKAIMKQNLIAFWASGNPDGIYWFLTAELLECAPADLLLLHDLLKREVEEETDTSTGGLNELTKGFFNGFRDVLYGILAERIERYKEDKDFLPLGHILDQALTVDQKAFHEIGQMVYHDYYCPEVIEQAQKSDMYRYYDEISNHFLKTCEQTQSNEVNNDDDALDANSGEVPSEIAEIRMVHLIDVVTCYIDVIH